MNEPVAWRYKYEDGDTSWNYQDNQSLIKSMIRVHHIIAEPLYAHPAKTLTEIIEKNKPEIEKANAYIKSLEDEIKALKKASEK